MDNVPDVLKVIVAILAILGFVSPILGAAAFWKLSSKFALRREVRGMAKRLNRKIDERTNRLEQDFINVTDRLEHSLTSAIKESYERTCKDINGLGEKWQATQKIAELAMVRADDADGALRVLQVEVSSIDEHGSKALARVTEAINELRLELVEQRKGTKNHGQP